MTPYWLFKCIDCGWYEQKSVLDGYCHMQRDNVSFASYCPDWCSRKKNGIQYTDVHKKATEE